MRCFSRERRTVRDEVTAEQLVWERLPPEERKARLEEEKQAAEGWVVVRPEKPLKPAQGRQYLRRTLAANLPGIVERFLQDGSAKSLTQLKLVAELLEPRVREKRKGKGTMQRLMEEWAAEDAVEGEDAEGEDAEGEEIRDKG